MVRSFTVCLEDVIMYYIGICLEEAVTRYIFWRVIGERQLPVVIYYVGKCMDEVVCCKSVH
jgi:hypothetical protein